jgi:hypothetical protein
MALTREREDGYADLATMSLMVGFAIMMTLGVAFG